MESIKGKWALVTGASRGIGAVLGVFLSDQKSGRIIRAQDFAGMTVEDAVKQFEAQ